MVDSSRRDDMSGATPLQAAAGFGTLDVVQYMIEEQHCDVECRNKETHTPLHSAALQGRLNIVKYLIGERGCDPMSRDQYGSIPLHCACDGGSLDVVKYMIEDVKVDSSCQDKKGMNPLHAAAFCGHLSVVKALVEDYLCDPGVRDKYACTAADWAKREGHTDITIYLSSIEKTVSSECVDSVVLQGDFVAIFVAGYMCSQFCCGNLSMIEDNYLPEMHVYNVKLRSLMAG